MPANHHIDTERRFIITTWEGEATDSNLLEALKSYQEKIQCKPEYLGFDEIVNMQGMSGVNISAKGVMEVARLASSTDVHRNNPRLAFVVSTGLVYSLIKMYAGYRKFAHNANKRIAVFKTEEDAYRWLGTE